MMLASITKEVIVPNYVDFKAKISVLNNQFEGYSDNKTESSFANLQQSWVDAVMSFQGIRALNSDRVWKMG